MSLQQVLDQVEFYTSTSAWQPISSGNPISFVTPSDQTAILSYITDLYNTSPMAKEVLDDYVTSGKPIRIADAISSSGTNAQPGFFDPSGSFLAYDLSSIGDLYYFNSNGEIVKEKPQITIIHEMVHQILGLNDTVGTGPGGSTTDADLNSATYDYDGDTLRKQNLISDEMGYTDNIQRSYDFAFLGTQPPFPDFQVGFSYSQGNEIDIARYGSDGNDNIDLSARTDGKNALLFGLAGNDVINGSNGRNYIYGGDGDDQILGGAANDTLWGNSGDDHVDGGAGDDTLFGGPGNDTLIGGDGDDRLVPGDGTATLTGGAGNDYFYFDHGDVRSYDGAVDYTVTDGDSSDELIWNGYRLTGGNFEIIEEESTPIGDGQTAVESIGDYLDGNGIIYQYAPGILPLSIILPTNQTISIPNFVDGMFGINLSPIPDQSAWDSLPRSNIANDGEFLDLDNLNGRSAALASAGVNTPPSDEADGPQSININSPGFDAHNSGDMPLAQNSNMNDANITGFQQELGIELYRNVSFFDRSVNVIHADGLSGIPSTATVNVHRMIEAISTFGIVSQAETLHHTASSVGYELIEAHEHNVSAYADFRQF